MSEGRQAGPISTRQLVVVVVTTFALYLILAFAAKSLDAYRLRERKQQLAAEVATLEQERVDLQAELDRRQTTAWLEEVLRDSGLIPEGVVGVVPVTATPAPPTPTPVEQPTPTPAATAEVRLFANPTWRAWRKLIWGGRW